MSKNKSIGAVIMAVIMAVIVGVVGFIMSVLKVADRKEKPEPLDLKDEGKVEFQVSFGGGARYVNTDQFEYAYLKCRFGGMEVYFDHADLKEGKGIIDIDASFSGVELYIPKDWRVVNNVHILLGTVENTNDPGEESGKIVTLTGNISSGAVEITYV